MKNLFNFFLIFLFVLSAQLNFAQSTGGNGTTSERENWLPNRGNVGIGTRSPSEALDVIGNVRVSQTVFTNNLETVGLKATTLNVLQDAFIGRHLLVSGNIGIGVSNPSERLEISGNLKVSNSIFGDILTVRQFTSSEGVVNNSLQVGQKFIVNGVTGLGINSPTERLEVSGNVKITQGLYSDFINTGDGIFSRNLNVTKNLFVNGNTGFGVSSPSEKLEVAGNAKISQGIFSNSVTSGTGIFSGNLQSNQNIIADGSIGIGVITPSEKLDILGNAKISQGVFSNSISSGDGLFSRNLRGNQNIIADGSIGIGVDAPSEKLEVAGNAKITQGLYSTTVNSTDGSFSGKLNVNQNAIVNGSVGIGVATPTEKLDVLGNIKSSADVIALNVRGDKGYFNTLESNGNLTINGNVGIGVTAPVEKLEVSGNIKATQGLFSDLLNTGDGTFSRNVQISQNLTVNGNTGLGVTTPTEKLDVNGNIKSTGDLIGANVRAGKGYFTSLESNGNLSINGNVGIGVTSPSEKLEVAGNIKATQGLLANTAVITQDISAGRNLTVTGNVGIGLPSGTDKLTVGGSAYVDGMLTAENLTVKQKLDIKGTFSVAGSLGIGVVSPDATLHVNGDGLFDGDIRANKIIVNTIEIAGASQDPTGGSSVSLGDNLFVNGSVGIGTNKTTGYKLSVDGKIRAGDDIKVYSSTEWSDFVFKKEYKLRSLTDVEDFIKSNGHLPEIPSAEQVKEQGIELAAMDAKLLQKIEELTLYMIEIKKENEKLKKEITSLKASNKK